MLIDLVIRSRDSMTIQRSGSNVIHEDAFPSIIVKIIIRSTVARYVLAIVESHLILWII
jgi:hypothetical protein